MWRASQPLQLLHALLSPTITNDIF
jgi:hypothetical protein